MLTTRFGDLCDSSRSSCAQTWIDALCSWRFPHAPPIHQLHLGSPVCDHVDRYVRLLRFRHLDFQCCRRTLRPLSSYRSLQHRVRPAFRSHTSCLVNQTVACSTLARLGRAVRRIRTCEPRDLRLGLDAVEEPIFPTALEATTARHRRDRSSLPVGESRRLTS